MLDVFFVMRIITLLMLCPSTLSMHPHLYATSHVLIAIVMGFFSLMTFANRFNSLSKHFSLQTRSQPYAAEHSRW